MSKFKILLVAALLTGLSAFAQDSSQPAPAPQQTRKHGDSAEKRLKRMNKRLNLTDEQKEKLLPILEDEEKQASAVDADTMLSQQQKHRKMHEIHRTARSQMDPILTAEQRTQMPTVRAGGGGRRGKRNGPSGAKNPDSTTEQ